MSTPVPNDSANGKSSPSDGDGKNAKGSATPQRSAAAPPAPAAAATNSTAALPPDPAPPPMMMTSMPPATTAMTLPPAVQWLKGRLEAGKKLYPNEDIATQRQSEIVVRFVRANIFPFEPDPLEREFRVCDLIHLIGNDSLSAAVWRELYRQLFSAEALAIPPVPRPDLRPPSLPPAPAPRAPPPPTQPVPYMMPLWHQPGQSTLNMNLSVEEQAAAAAIDTTAQPPPQPQPAAAKPPLGGVRRQHSPKLTPQQWMDLLRGYYAARLEYKIKYGPGAHLSPQTFCVDIGESLRISTLNRKWNESGLEALVQQEWPVDHDTVVACLTAYRDQLAQPKKSAAATRSARLKTATTATAPTATSTDIASVVVANEATQAATSSTSLSSSQVETVAPPDEGQVQKSNKDDANDDEPVSSAKDETKGSCPIKDTETESESDQVAPTKAAEKASDRQPPKRESKRQRTKV